MGANVEINQARMWKHAYLRAIDDTVYLRNKSVFLEHKIEKLVTAGELMKDYILCGDGTMGDVTEEWDAAINSVSQPNQRFERPGLESK